MYKKMLFIVILSARLCVAELPTFSESLHCQDASSQACADGSIRASSFTAEQRAELKEIIPAILLEMAQAERHKAEAELQQKECATKIKNEEALHAQVPGQLVIGVKKVGGVLTMVVGGGATLIFGYGIIESLQHDIFASGICLGLATVSGGAAYLGKKLYDSAHADAATRADILERLKSMQSKA